MAITSGQLAQHTARMGVARMGTTRMGAVLTANEMDSSGLYVWRDSDFGLHPLGLFDEAAFRAYYKFEADASDEFGGASLAGVSSHASDVAAHFELADESEETGSITASLTNVGAVFQTGINGNGVLFTNSDTLTLSDADTNSAFDFGTGDFAFHIKFKRANSGGSVAGLFQKLSGFDGFDLRLTAGNAIQVFVGNGGSLDQMAGSTTFGFDSQWHSVSVFRVSGTVSLYADGEFETSMSNSGDVDNTADFRFGLGSGQSFTGMLDQAIFYGAGGSFAGDIASAAADYHAGILGGEAGPFYYAPVYVTGWHNNGVRLNKLFADSPYFTLASGSATDFDPGTSSFVLFLTVKFNSLDADAGIYYKGATSGSTAGLRVVATSAGLIEVLLRDGTNTYTLTSTESVAENGGTYRIALVVSRDAKLATLYINEQEAGTVSLIGCGSLSNSSADLYLGAHPTTDLTLDGVLDQFSFARGRIWTPSDVVAARLAVDLTTITARCPIDPWSEQTGLE